MQVFSLAWSEKEEREGKGLEKLSKIKMVGLSPVASLACWGETTTQFKSFEKVSNDRK